MIDTTDERWLPVNGTPGYEVSDLGRVRSFKSGTACFIKPQAGRVRLQHKHKALRFNLAELVFDTFGYPREGGVFTHHIDGDKTNNTIDNLIALTTKEDALVRRSSLTATDVRAIRKDTRYRHVIAEAYGVVKREIDAGVSQAEGRHGKPARKPRIKAQTSSGCSM